MLKKFKKEDALNIKNVREEQSESAITLRLLKEYPEMYTSNPNNGVYSIKTKDDKDVLAIAGTFFIRPELYESWMIVPEDALEIANKNMKTIVKDAKTFIKILPTGRFQTYVRKDFKKAQRFLEFLGFEKEGLMKDYYPNMDCYLYALIKRI